MKLKKIKSLLKDSQLDLAELKKLTWGGIPSEHRSLIWKILMGYAPTLIERRQETINRKRKEYFDYRKRIFIKHNEINEINEMHLDVELWHQIQIDVPRTCPESELIQDKVIQKLLERLLYIWSTRHPASGYVQGINDLATPFIMVFIADYFKNGKKIQPESLTQVQLDEVESDVFWCLSKLLDGIQDNFTSAQRGIQRQLALLKYLLIKIDVKLANHLQNEQLHYVQFAFRWMNCLLMREFQLNQIIRIWDTYLSETPIGFSQFHVYVCAALLSHFSSQLLKLDFQELIMFLQNLPTKQWDTKEIEVLLSQAYLWCTIFNDAPNHLI
ncbi:RabGAP/TBC [Neoconidiobolus thromboides FSU 785]|nr:RabGAP/TBC [Neoconidiobolus thromboides FSU 785]